MLNDICYIIGHRSSKNDSSRDRNLKAVLMWLKANFPFEVLVVEQDSAETSVKRLVESFGFRYKFLYNSGFYNRSWAFNVGVSMTEKSFIVCADNDVFMMPSQLKESLLGLMMHESISPKNTAIDLSESMTQRFAQDCNASFTITAEGRFGINFSSMLVAFRRHSYFRIGGWDENFRGWGGEDDAQTFKIKKILKCFEFQNPAFHLNHSRNQATGNGTPHHQLYKNNVDILNRVSSYNEAELNMYISNLLVVNGNENKYRNEVC